MRKSAFPFAAAIAAGAVVIAIASPITRAATPTDEETIVQQGREIAFDRTKGNCLACHAIQGGASPGNIAPPLIVMQKRFPTKEKIREQIWDARTNNPNTVMPPFGAHMILSEDEIDKVVEFVWTL